MTRQGVLTVWVLLGSCWLLSWLSQPPISFLVPGKPGEPVWHGMHQMSWASGSYLGHDLSALPPRYVPTTVKSRIIEG